MYSLTLVLPLSVLNQSQEILKLAIFHSIKIVYLKVHSTITTTVLARLKRGPPLRTASLTDRKYHVHTKKSNIMTVLITLPTPSSSHPRPSHRSHVSQSSRFQFPFPDAPRVSQGPLKLHPRGFELFSTEIGNALAVMTVFVCGARVLEVDPCAVHQNKKKKAKNANNKNSKSRKNANQKEEGKY